MPTKIFGYANKISARPGEPIDVFVSAVGSNRADAHLVRLIHGDVHSAGPGYIEREVACDANGVWEVQTQRTQVGSYLTTVDHQRVLDDLASFTLFTFVYPTLPTTHARQTLMGRWDGSGERGYSLDIDESGHLSFRCGTADALTEVRDEDPLEAKTWYFVAVTVDSVDGVITLHRRCVVSRYNGLLSANAFANLNAEEISTRHEGQLPRAAARFLMACADVPSGTDDPWTTQHFHGKLDRPGVLHGVARGAELVALALGETPAAAGTVAYWDTTAGYGPSGIGHLVVDVGPNGIHAYGQNYPVRGQTGWNWSGRHDSFHTGPHEYGGVEFHADAVIDCKWQRTRQIVLPSHLKSGVYAIRLRIGDGEKMNEEYVVFFVRASSPQAKICLLVPTQSYLAYANEHLSLDAPSIQPMMGQPPIVDDVDIEMYQNPEFGYATYDTYADGGGVSYSSYLRTLFTMRPK
jgi:N,N-dimethylformamidase